MPRTPKPRARPSSPKASNNLSGIEASFVTRQTRSGAFFSPYALELENIDLESLYQRRIAERDAHGEPTDPEIVVLPGKAIPDLGSSTHSPASPRPSPAPNTSRPCAGNGAATAVASATPAAVGALAADPPLPNSPTVSAAPMLSAKENSKRKKKAKRAAAREAQQLASGAPYIKGVGLRRMRQAFKQQIRLNVDAADFAHTAPAWVGLREPENIAPDDTAPFSPGADVLDGTEYTQQEVDALPNAYGLRLLRWNGRETLPIVDARRRLLVLLGGQPRGENWAGIVEGAGLALEERAPRIKLSKEKLRHRRAEDQFPALARGVSHGGGQTEPGELMVQGENKAVTDELLAHKSFQDIVGFTMYLLFAWMPLLFAAYADARSTYAARMPGLRWPFAGSVFAACTWNFLSTVCTPHVDFANLVWGWCAITALGRFNPDRGGHIILWDLRLIIRFPPGATIFIPSALLTHSNTPIAPGETRSSFVQYSAGGLFRWIDQNFQTQEDFFRTATEEQRAEAATRAAGRWTYGLGHFSIIDELFPL